MPYRTVQTYQKYCICETSYSCSCCQNVIILYTKVEKNRKYLIKFIKYYFDTFLCSFKSNYFQVIVLIYFLLCTVCVNFTYQRNGLNIDITLNSDMLRARTITDYKSLKFCTNIPGCYFSSACVNVLELNKFPRYGILKCNSFIIVSYNFY